MWSNGIVAGSAVVASMTTLYVCTGLATPILSPAGQQLDRQVFRSSVLLVPVNVRVIDESGRPVTDLRREDFTVLEDGVAQRVEYFVLQRHGTTGVDASPSFADDPPVREPRTFALVLGRGRLQEPAMGLDAAMAFVRDRLGAEDRVCVVAYGRATDCSNDHASAIRLIERFTATHASVEARLRHWFSGMQAVFGSGELPSGARREIDALFRAPDLPRVRQLPIGVPPGEGQFEEDRRLVLEALAGDDRGLIAQRIPNTAGRQDLELLHAAIEYVRYEPGEKHVVFVTEQGLQVGATHYDLLAAMAADARVTVSTLRTGGLSTSWSGSGEFSGPSVAEAFRVRDARALAEETGGMAFAYVFADAALDDLAQAMGHSYLLGYYPLDDRQDGRRRAVEVRVNRRGTRLVYRRGYYARDHGADTEMSDIKARARVLAAGGSVRPMTDIPIDARFSQLRRQAGQWFVNVSVHIPASAVSFAEGDGRQTSAVSVAIFVGRGADEVVGELWRRVDLRLKPETYARYQREGIRLTARIDLKAPGRRAKVVVYDHDADRLGTTISSIR